MNQLASKRSERGAVLLVSLIMLLLLTIIGVAAMRDTNLQERMAGNMRDRNLAFQAAEAGLRFAEQQIANKYGDLIKMADYETKSDAYDGFGGSVSAKPTYSITKLPHPGQLDLTDMVNPETAGGDSIEAGIVPILNFVLVRIESTGTGMSEDSTVTLRSLYFVEE